MLSPKFDEEAVSILNLTTSEYNSETALLSAILERAILDYIGNDRNEASQAAEWIFEDIVLDDNSSQEVGYTPKAFSFKWICDYLDLNPFKVAKYIQSMPKRGKNRVAPWYSDKSRSYSTMFSVR